jgi:hypothetical protein
VKASALAERLGLATTATPRMRSVERRLCQERWSSLAPPGSLHRRSMSLYAAGGHDAAVRKRLERARREGDLPKDVRPADLASFIATVLRGMAVQAKSAASRQVLQRVAEMALRVWPG